MITQSNYIITQYNKTKSNEITFIQVSSFSFFLAQSL